MDGIFEIGEEVEIIDIKRGFCIGSIYKIKGRIVKILEKSFWSSGEDCFIQKVAMLGKIEDNCCLSQYIPVSCLGRIENFIIKGK